MKNYSGFIKDLTTLISFKSVQGESKENAPFGEENAKALNYFLTLAKDFGFETINYDGYVGEVVYGDGEEIGLIGHLDVVPAGDGWDSDPFTLTGKDGYLFGRGVLDDKTGCLILLYALKELKDSGKKINKKFRLFLGINEESGWRDVEYLKTKTDLPKYGFSPDGNFPLGYAEKGMYEVCFSIPSLKNFHSLSGGTVVNAVCAKASCVAVKKIDDSLVKKYSLSIDNNGVIHSVGKSAHGSTPHLGVNALKNLFDFFLETGEDVKAVCDYIMHDKGGIFSLKNEQGTITLSPDLLSEQDGRVFITADLRIPAPFTIETAKAVLDTFNIDYAITERHPPVMVEKDGAFVNALLTAYNNVTGENAKPVSLGGSTFARAFACGCSFGPCFPNSDNCCHEANEHVSEKDLNLSYEIYYKALVELSK